MDEHSRWIEGFAIKEISASTIAKLLVEQVVLRFGPVHSLLSDRGSNFMSQITREVCKLFRIQKIDIAAYHPESNAHVERIHRVHLDMLSKYVNSDHTDWDKIFLFLFNGLTVRLSNHSLRLLLKFMGCVTCMWYVCVMM